MVTAFEKHNHKACVKTGLAQVEELSKSQGLRLTDIRKRVLAILLESHEAMGAYDILNRLVEQGEPAQPPIVYRALSFLTENGFAHKVETQNAYIACQFPEREHQAGLLICRRCQKVGECCLERQMLSSEGFHTEAETVEAQGLCQHCYEEEHASS